MEQIKPYEKILVNLKESLIRLGDLINSEGPLLSIFKDYRSNDLYIFDWVDTTENKNKWLIYKVTPKLLNQFIHKEFSYKDLFNFSIENTDAYYADIVTFKEDDYAILPLDNMPNDYLPTEEVYFNENSAKNLDIIINSVNRIIYPDRSETLLTINTVNRADYVLTIGATVNILTSQTPISDIDVSIFKGYEGNKFFSDNLDKIEQQHNDREINRLPENSRMVLHL